jgi:hypothetical protein
MSRMRWLLGWMGSRRRIRVINAVGEMCKIERFKDVSLTHVF